MESRGITFHHPRSGRQYGVLLTRTAAHVVDVEAVEIIPGDSERKPITACFVLLDAPSEFYADNSRLLTGPLYHAAERAAPKGVTLTALLP